MRPAAGPPRIVFAAALSLGLLGLVFGIALLWLDRNVRLETAERWLDGVQLQAAAAREQLEIDLDRLSDIGNGLAAELAAGLVRLDEIEARLEDVAQKHPYVFGVGVMLRPYAHDPEQRLFSRYLVKRNGAYEMTRVEDAYDYTEAEWFQQGVEAAGWIEPFFGEVSQAMLALYCVPFQLPRQEEATDGPESDGAICIDYSIEDVWELVGALDVGKTGYAIVITAEGGLVSHPQQHYVRQELSLFDLAERLDDRQLLRLAERATALESGAMAHTNELTGQDSWIIFGPIPAANWSLAVIAFHDEIPLDLTDHRRRLILATGALILGMTGLIIAMASWQPSAYRRLWVASGAVAVLFLFGIVHIWTLEFAEAGRDPPEAVMLLDLAGMEGYLDDYRERARQQALPDPIQVPTGVLVQAVRFETPHDFVVTGFIWQRYSSPAHDELVRGVFFPDAIPEKDVLEELYRVRDGDTEVIGWFFKTSLHQPSDYSRFPIDVRTLRLRIWHPDIAHHVVLVPELPAYRLLHPTSLPGLEDDFALPGWHVRRSFFAYRFHDYGTDFGLRGHPKTIDYPELNYNITLLRHLTDAFISNQIPLFVAAVMLFAMLIIDTRRKQQASLYGFTTARVLGTAAAIFFIILLAHIDIRRRYAAEQVMYLEYFYFITYFAIVGLSINAFMLAREHYNYFFHYKDNLIPKLLFWPLLHGAFFLVTVYVFY